MTILALCKTDLLTQLQTTAISTTLQTTTTALSNLGATYTVTAIMLAPTQLTPLTPVPVPNGLSTGAKAGIGIGTTVGAMLLIILGANLNSFLRRRRRRSNTVKPFDAVGTGLSIDRQESVKELGDTAICSERQILVQELDGPNPIGHRVSRKELDGTHWKRELEGDTPKRSNV
jgi:hypothetical protein